MSTSVNDIEYPLRVLTKRPNFSLTVVAILALGFGATTAGVLKTIVGQGLRLVLFGMGIGFIGALVLGRVLGSMQYMLYDVSPTDSVTFGGVLVLLIGAALLACYIPARRAVSIDPMEALRYE